MDSLKPSDPKQIGDIRLLGRLGQGGMGLVYFGVTAEGDPVAVKMILPAHADKPTVRERFNREIVAMRMVQGPRVAAIIDASDEDAEQPWLAVEYIRGMTLREYVDSHGPLTTELGAALGVLLAEAVRAIHQAQLLHRDLSPRNILLGRDGPKVIDFGLAALADVESDLTGTGEVLGNPGCIAPEQINTPKDVTKAADIYGLAACLLFGLTGHYPFERRPQAALLFAIASPSMPPDLTGVPAELESLIARMLDKAPGMRPALPEVTARFEEVLAVPVMAGRTRLATATYVERPDDPPLDAVRRPVPPRPPRRPRPEPRPHSPIVDRLSDRLRTAYARGASL
jgi:serine/threonine protein kinase